MRVWDIGREAPVSIQWACRKRPRQVGVHPPTPTSAALDGRSCVLSDAERQRGATSHFGFTTVYTRAYTANRKLKTKALDFVKSGGLFLGLSASSE